MNEEAVLARARAVGICRRLDRCHGAARSASGPRLCAACSRALDGVDAPSTRAAAPARASARPIAIPGIDADHAAELALEDGGKKAVTIRARRAAGHRATGLSPPALRRARDHPRRGAAALRHRAGHRRRRADVGRGRAGLQPAPRPAMAASATSAPCATLPRRPRGHGADAVALNPVRSLFPARSGAMRALLAVEPAVPQSAATPIRRPPSMPASSPPTSRWQRATGLIDWTAAGAAKFAACCALSRRIRPGRHAAAARVRAVRRRRRRGPAAARPLRGRAGRHWTGERPGALPALPAMDHGALFAAAQQAARAAGMRIGL